MSTAAKTTRRIEPAAVETDDLGIPAETPPPPDPPRPVTPPVHPWEPALISGTQDSISGSALRVDGGGIEMCFTGGELSRNFSQWQVLKAKARERLDATDRAAIKGRLKAAIDDDSAIRAAQEDIRRLPEQIARLEAVQDSWDAKRRLLEIDGASAAEIQEANLAIVAADRDLETAKQGLQQARDTLTGLTAKRKRDAATIASEVLNSTLAGLKARRLHLIQTIGAKIAVELIELADVELALMVAPPGGRDPNGFGSEALQALTAN